MDYQDMELHHISAPTKEAHHWIVKFTDGPVRWLELWDGPQLVASAVVQIEPPVVLDEIEVHSRHPQGGWWMKVNDTILWIQAPDPRWQRIDTIAETRLPTGKKVYAVFQGVASKDIMDHPEIPDGWEEVAQITVPASAVQLTRRNIYLLRGPNP